MTLLEDGNILRVLDGIACALFAAAAAIRARNLGAHITGSIVLGCLCGLMGPLLREAFLHGPAGTGFILRQFPADSLLGSLGGLAALMILPSRNHAFFFWTDALGMALAASLASLLALPELGLTGAFALGLVYALSPGLIRDVALGDTALLIDQEWYAAAAALAGVASLAVFLWLNVGWITDCTASHAEITSVCAGVAVCLCIRYLCWRKPGEI